MTTPRDDIAGLSDRLREWIEAIRAPNNANLTLVDIAILNGECVSQDMEDAATQLDTLSAMVKELEERQSYHLPDDVTAHIVHLQKRVAETAEAEARALRAEQERDEAIKLIRPLTILAEDSAALLSGHNSKFTPQMYSLAARARSFVRRLASGPEKE